MKPASLLTATLLLMSVPAHAACQEPIVLAEFDVPRDGDALVIPGTVNGKTIMFLVDTGSRHNAMDKARLPADPKETMKLFVPNGRTVVRCKYELPLTRVAGQILQESDRILGVDLRELRDATGYEIYGILGMDFLRQHVIRLDFDQGKLAFLKKVPDKSGYGMCLSFTNEGIPNVTGAVSGAPEDVFFVNTGLLNTISGTLKHDAFRRLGEDGSLRVVDRVSAKTPAGSVRVPMGQAGQLRVGPFGVAKPVFSQSGVNVVGLGYLSRFQVVFDFPNGLMYLKKGHRFDEPDYWARSSIQLIRSDGKTVIASVGRDRGAAISQLRAGDVIIQIAGKSADHASLFQLRRLLCTDDKEVRVTVQRGDQRIETTLVLGLPGGGR